MISTLCNSNNLKSIWYTIHYIKYLGIKTEKIKSLLLTKEMCHVTDKKESMRWAMILQENSFYFFILLKECTHMFHFILFFFLLYNIVLVLPYIDMNLPQVYTCSPSWTPLPPPPPNHPSGSSQCTSPEHPVSCIKTGLVIHFTYDNIHVSMPFSQIIPPSPSLTESKRLLYTFVSLLLSRIQGYHCHTNSE